jgi:hypothetical protein
MHPTMRQIAESWCQVINTNVHNASDIESATDVDSLFTLGEYTGRDYAAGEATSRCDGVTEERSSLRNKDDTWARKCKKSSGIIDGRLYQAAFERNHKDNDIANENQIQGLLPSYTPDSLFTAVTEALRTSNDDSISNNSGSISIGSPDAFEGNKIMKGILHDLCFYINTYIASSGTGYFVNTSSNTAECNVEIVEVFKYRNTNRERKSLGEAYALFHVAKFPIKKHTELRADYAYGKNEHSCHRLY